MRRSRFFKNNSSKKNTNNFSTQNKNYSLLLPPPAMLESYEELSPGITDQLIEIAKKEQSHRQKWENSYLKSMKLCILFGQLLAFIFSISTLYYVVRLAREGNAAVASMMCICWFAFFILANNSFKKRKAHLMHKKYRN